jgi:hypothetical protein
VQQTAPSFDDLVGKLLELRRHIKAACRGGLEVDHQIEPHRALYRQVAWLGTVQDFRDVISASSEDLAYVRPVSNETRSVDRLGRSLQGLIDYLSEIQAAGVDPS